MTGASNVSPPDAASLDSPGDLPAWAEAYARDVVATADLAVDCSLVEWDVSTRAKRRAGAVIAPDFPDATVGEPYDWTGVPRARRECTVRLTWEAFEELGRDAMAGTVRHELVHVAQFQRYGTTGHGDDFERRAARLDAPLTCESFATPAYLLACDACGETVARRFRRSKVVKHPDRYRSGCCGAPLVARENTDG